MPLFKLGAVVAVAVAAAAAAAAVAAAVDLFRCSQNAEKLLKSMGLITSILLLLLLMVYFRQISLNKNTHTYYTAYAATISGLYTPIYNYITKILKSISISTLLILIKH